MKRPGAAPYAGMRQILTLHPQSPCPAVVRIEVIIARSRGGDLLLSYCVTGDISGLRIPPIAAAARADELWRHTCFEAFVRPLPGEAYWEFNFAPSTRWAAYSFDGYRKGMRVAAEIDAPQIEVSSAPERYTIQASLNLSEPVDVAWRVGLAAVIEGDTGRLSYWALAHPPGKPDFHRADCFTCEI